MKIQAFAIKMSLVAIMAIFGVGCAKKSDGGGSTDEAPPVVTGPTTPRDTDDERGDDWQEGATAALTADSTAALNYYALTHPVNNPTDLRISVKLVNKGSASLGSNKYVGKVMVSYHDNGQYYTGRFVTEDKTNPGSGTVYPNWHHASYNTWFTDPRTGKVSFHGFYQDQYGAVMIIVDDLIDQGDGAGANYASGSIWFKNFAQSQYNDCGQYQGSTGYWPGGSSSCQNIWVVPSWFRTAGPYDTRTFLQSGGPHGDGVINTTSVLYPSESHYYTSHSQNPYIPQEPSRGWRRLGTFSNLNKNQAFTQ